MSSNYSAGPGSGASSNGSSSVSRREMRASNTTGALPALGSTSGVERGFAGSFDFEYMIQSLRELFEHDRQVASQSESTRCGICYLYFPSSELRYRDEGFYVCQGCGQALGGHDVPMLRKQQKL